MARIEDLAERLDSAARDAFAIPQLAEELTLDDAYAVQNASIKRRKARGERPVGYKMGFTSRAKALQMGVHEVIWGQLTDAMRVADKGAIARGRFVHPRVEPELAFRLGRPLSGDVSEAQALEAIDAVAPALEIIDSRYENFKFSLTDVVADNSSSSAFVVGDWQGVREDLDRLELVMSADGAVAETGPSSAILGHPLRSLVEAARLLQRHGHTLSAGDIFMAGGATAAIPLAGRKAITLHVVSLGDVGFEIED